MKDDDFGLVRVTMKRSLRGIAVGSAFLVCILGGLVIWNLVMRPGMRGILGASIVAGVSLLAIPVFISVPYTVAIHQVGISTRSPWRRPAYLAWGDIRSVHIRTAPLGRHPTMVTILVRGNKRMTFSEVEYSHVDDLIDALFANVADQVQDERKPASQNLS